MDSQPYRTAPTFPPHVACYLCTDRPEFFTFHALERHYREVHPLVLVRREVA